MAVEEVKGLHSGLTLTIPGICPDHVDECEDGGELRIVGPWDPAYA